MKIRFAVHIVIPLLILFSGLSVIAMQYAVSERYDIKSIREEARNHFRLVNSQIRESANKQLGPDDLEKLNNQLRSMRSTQGDLELAVVVDESNVILASTDARQIRQPFSELPVLSSMAAQIDRDAHVDEALSEIDKNDLIRGVFPFELLDNPQSGEYPEAGLVAIVLNKQHALQIMQEKRLAVATYSGLLLALMTVLLWFFMSRFLVLPLQKLISTVRSFAKGDYSVSANLKQDNEMGEISSLLDSLAMITKEREKAEASRNRLAQIVEESVSEIYIVEAENYQILNANSAARRNLGYSLEDCQTLFPWDIIESVTEDTFDQVSAPLRNGDVAFFEFESRHRRKDGSTYPVHVVSQYMATQTPPVFVAIAQDITERKRQEQNVQLRDRAIAELDVGVSILDAKKPTYPIVYVNRRLCEMSGYSAEQLLFNGAELLRDEKLNSVELPRLNASIKKGKPAQGVMNYRRRDGTGFVGDVTLSPVHGSEGELTHYIAIIQDITERLETEARLHRSQKIEAIGQLAGGVAHDFNNLLSVIIGNIEFLKLSVYNDKHVHLLNQADVAAQMGARLTRKLLRFAKQDQLEPVVLDANEQVREAMNLLRTTIGENYHLRFALARDLWRIRADPGGVENAVINLTLNARDAMPEGGRILIETCNVSLDDGDVNELLGVLPGDYIRLSVADSGVGMTPEIKERIFEPFFTTKDVGENTGLGLASTYGFAQQSGGNVVVDSKAGSGATISLLLPRYDETRDIQRPADEPAVSTAQKNGRVLVVEDDDMVRDLTVERLHVLGYHTTQAANGPDAIALLQQNEHYDLVLTDLVMDGRMSGYDVADWVRLHHPECKVLLTSGYSDERVHDVQSTSGCLPLLQKPYKMAELQDAIDVLLVGD